MKQRRKKVWRKGGKEGSEEMRLVEESKIWKRERGRKDEIKGVGGEGRD